MFEDVWTWDFRSLRLARKILYFVNAVELAEGLNLKVKDTLHIGYFKAHHGRKASEVGYGIGLATCRKILEARGKVGRFTKLEELESVKGVGVDKFVDLVNVFKTQ